MIVVVAGTGTDVGKTFVTSALLAELRAQGAPASAWKPVASGVLPGQPSPDSAAHAEALGAPVEPPLHCFQPPLSPHLAARRAGVHLTVAAIVARARALAERPGWLFVETAGGLFSPLNGTETNADLARALGGLLLLVAPDRLGVLHDVLATTRAAAPMGVHADTIALSCPEVPDDSTGTNGEELGRLLGVRPAEFPRGAPGAAGMAAACREVLYRLEAARGARCGSERDEARLGA
ncbi:MAG: dethiobiotin synthase [Polyangiaceae bacterium]|jgi:dethiobiotin synthetase|nr:dethiobiotin synthase [Polyangiaceae bacterium]